MSNFALKVKELTSDEGFNEKINHRLGEISIDKFDDAQFNQALATIVLEEAKLAGVEISKEELLSYTPEVSDDELASVSGGISTQSGCALGVGLATAGCGVAAIFTTGLSLAASALPAAGLGVASNV